MFSLAFQLCERLTVSDWSIGPNKTLSINNISLIFLCLSVSFYDFGLSEYGQFISFSFTSLVINFFSYVLVIILKWNDLHISTRSLYSTFALACRHGLSQRCQTRNKEGRSGTSFSYSIIGAPFCDCRCFCFRQCCAASGQSCSSILKCTHVILGIYPSHQKVKSPIFYVWSDCLFRSDGASLNSALSCIFRCTPFPFKFCNL